MTRTAPRDTYFDDDAMIRRVHREQIVALCGGRSLLLMAAHPVAFEGFFMSTGSLDEPYERLRRAGLVLDTIAWGSRHRADAMLERVRAMHREATGTIPAAAGAFPAGTPYRADDPELLLWILASLVDSALLVYERCVASLTDEERERYWQDYRVIGTCFGIPEAAMPRTVEDFDAYMATMLASEELFVTEKARELGREIVLNPPVRLLARPLVELGNTVTVGWLPARVRRMYGLRWDPARAVALRGGAEYAKRVLVPLLPDRLRLVPSARTALAA
ncbi:oxygenase MpaB family protein [Paraconexibacter sp.]|uniref:oxygenase MpaB family protein n=1 Tax=Paraconexibacter sp. TaxID=2949640 RepID=UPI0035632B7F